MWNVSSKKIVSMIIVLDLLVVGSFLALYKYKQKYIVNFRQALFSSMTANDDIFSASPDILISRYGFKTEPKQLKEEFYSSLANIGYVQNGRRAIEGQKDEINKAKSVVLLFQKEDEDKLADFPSFLEEIKTFAEPNVYGDCSDNAEVFAALGSFFGLTVREVHNTVHVFSEMYDHDLHKWIWIDPENAIMARNDKGEYLSLVEMTQRYYKNEKINFELFGRNKEPEMKKNYFYYYYDGKDKFSYIMMTLGNNFYQVDQYRNRLSFLPKIFRQFILLVGNIQPHYVIYSGDRAVITEWKLIKYLSIIVISGVILMNIFLVFIIYYWKSPKSIKQS
jgi:hypothetical protein